MAVQVAASDLETPYYCNSGECFHRGELHMHCACGVKIAIDQEECLACTTERHGHLPSRLDAYEWLVAAQKVIQLAFTDD